MNMTIEPNIFEYATSELSQDAFLCYLLSFGSSNYSKTEEYKLARSFLKELHIEEDIEEIKRQKSHIDVLILTQKYAVVLEDKTFSKEHSEQLKRYVEKCKNDYPNKNVKLLYFKTGYTSIQEKDELNKYEADIGIKIDIFDVKRIVSVSKKYDGNDVIIKMWLEKIREKYNNIKNVENTNGIDKLENYTPFDNQLQQDVYLDLLTQEFKKNFKRAYWYRAGQGITPHIRLEERYIPYNSEHYEIHFGIYIMFRKEAWIIVKEHLYNEGHKYRFKLYEKEYTKYKDELDNLKHNLQQAITDDGWEKKNEDKDKLIILKKKIINMENCIKDIKKLQEIIKIIGTPIDNPS